MTASSSPSSEEAVQHRSWRRWAIGSVIVLVLLLLPVAALLLYEARLVAEATHRIAEMDRTEPGWRGPFKEREPLPADRDSMVAVRRISAMLPKHWDKEIADNGYSMIDSSFTPAPCLLPQKDADDLAIVMKRSDPVLAVARTIKDLPEGGPTAKMDELMDSKDGQQARQVAALLEYAIFDRLQRKDVAGAWELCRAERNLGKPIDQGALIAGLIKIALSAMADSGLERTLAHGEIPETDFAEMQRVIAAEGEVDYFYPFMTGECAFWLKICDDAIADPAKAKGLVFGIDENKIGWWGKLNERYPRPMFLKSKVDSIERMAALYRLRPLRGFARYDAMDRLERTIDPPAMDGTERLTWQLPVILKVAYAERRLLARLGCAEVALAAERFRLKEGRWPATAAELVDKGLLGKVPEDPFDGSPLRMRHFADGLVVYAVGPKRDYDGTDWDNFDNMDTTFREGTEFRLWNPDRRHQPPLPPLKKLDAEDPPAPPE